MAGESVPSSSIVPSDAPVPGKGAVPAPTGTTKVIVGTGTAGQSLLAAASGIWSPPILTKPQRSAAALALPSAARSTR